MGGEGELVPRVESNENVARVFDTNGVFDSDDEGGDTNDDENRARKQSKSWELVRKRGGAANAFGQPRPVTSLSAKPHTRTELRNRIASRVAPPSCLDELQKLAELMTAGVVSESEMQAIKADIFKRHGIERVNADVGGGGEKEVKKEKEGGNKKEEAKDMKDKKEATPTLSRDRQEKLVAFMCTDMNDKRTMNSYVKGVSMRRPYVRARFRNAVKNAVKQVEVWVGYKISYIGEISLHQSGN
jgi:hypothetical protein